MTREWSRRTEGLAQSEIRAMTIECARVKGINMSQGVCDTPVPEAVSRGAQRAIDLGLNTYSRFDGLPELRQAIARKLADYNGISADPETEITVSAGVPGEAFFKSPDGQRFMRFCFAKKDDELEEASRRIEQLD